MNPGAPFLKNLWRRAAGLPELEPVKPIGRTPDELRASQWSAEFESLMRNRLVIGALRYGLIGAPGKPRYNRPDAIRTKLQHYEETGNTETLVDVANLALLEYVEGDHPRKHFKALDDKIHTNIKNT